MYATDSTGNSPTAVSPESMIALVPSRIAFATSDASARVGSGAWIIDSSICVAVITGLPRSSARRMIRFCSSGTSAAPISTPRSPRATMTRVRLAEDVVERRDRLRLLDLRDHVRRRAGRLDQRLQRLHVGGRADERERDVVDAELERELEVVDVLARQRRDRERDAGQVDALVRGDDAADEHLAARAARGRRETTRRRTEPSSISTSKPGWSTEPSTAGAIGRSSSLGDVLARDRHLRRRARAERARRGRRRGASAPAGRRSARAGARPRPAAARIASALARDPRACRARS